MWTAAALPQTSADALASSLGDGAKEDAACGRKFEMEVTMMNWKITVQYTAGVVNVDGGGTLEDFACAAGAIALTIVKALKDQGEKPAEALESVLNFERDYVRDNLGAEFIGDYMTVDAKLYREMQRELMHKADEELAMGGEPGAGDLCGPRRQ